MMGERLGKWTLSREIGRGGMGRVYLAQEDVTGRQAAVKILSTELATDPGFLTRFQREIETLSQLDHPHIVRFFDSGNDASRYFYAMEFVPGQSLEGIVDTHGRLGWREVCEIALQILPALKHVHDHGVIHRDLKLSNLLVRDDGIVKLTDFGIAKIFSSTHLTQTGGVVGTAEYLSPEQATGKPVTKKSDIYSLGVVFYGLLTGRLPFEGTGFLELMHKHRYAQFDRPAKIVLDLPYEIDEVICQMLEKDPAKRPADCLVLAKQIDSIRKKLERKDQATEAPLGDTIAQTRAVFDPKNSEGPITLAERTGRARPQNVASGPIGRLFNHPMVVGVLLAVCLGTIAYAFWPPGPETLFRKGSEMMASDRLADLEIGWKDYLQPLKDRFPDHPYQGEVEKLWKKLEAARNPPVSEGQRFLNVADRHLEAGDIAGAAVIYEKVLVVFADEKDVATQARKKLDELRGPEARAARLKSVQPQLDRAAALAAKGDRAEAEVIWSALEVLYRADPSGDAIIEAIRNARSK